MSYLGRSAKLSLKAQEKVSFLATAGQTVKTGLSYVPSFVEVYVNGVLLTDTTDFTATNGNSVTFTVALLLNDEVTVISLKTFTVADHYSKTEADTLLAAKATNTALATTNTAVALKAPIASPSFTGTVSGADDFISTKAGGVFLKNTSGGTSGTQIMIANTGGSMRAGVESSAGNAVQGGTLPYAAVFGNQGNYPTQFTTSGSARMTIVAAGNVVMGGISAGSLSGVNAGLTIRTTNTNSGICFQSGGAATDTWQTFANQSAQFKILNASTANGAYLQYNSGSGWTNVSDQRWKTDWSLLEDSSSKITALNIGKYHMLDGSKETIDGAKWDYGVKAQELFEVIPDAVDVPLDSEDKYGVVPNIVFWHSVKALQEALAKIDAMETRLTALEGAAP